jgi:hypothetical protein
VTTKRKKINKYTNIKIITFHHEHLNTKVYRDDEGRFYYLDNRLNKAYLIRDNKLSDYL